MAKKRYGLKLKDDFGAPTTPHTVPGVPGLYRPDVPTPVGEEGELGVKQARAFAKEHSDVLEVVTITAGNVEDAKEQAAADLAEARSGVIEAREDASGAEEEQVAEQTEAVKGA